jgi:hypothetical protein
MEVMPCHALIKKVVEVVVVVVVFVPFDVNTSLNSVRCRGVSTKTLATKQMARFVALISRKL